MENIEIQAEENPSPSEEPTPGAPPIDLDDDCKALLERSHSIALSWEWPCSGVLSLLAASAEPGVLELLLEELTRGVLEADETMLLREELRARVQYLSERHSSFTTPEAGGLNELLGRAFAIALDRQDTYVRPVHLAQALVIGALEMGPGTLGVADYLLLRRLAIGPRLAGAPPASRRIASMDLNDYRIRPEVLDLLPPKLCRQHGILPLKRSGDTLYVATADPDGFRGYDDVSFWAGSRVELVRVTQASLEEVMLRHLPDESQRSEPHWQVPVSRPSGLSEPGSAARDDLLPSGPLDAKAVPETFDRLQRLLQLDSHDQRYFGIRGDLYMRIHYLKEAAEAYWKATELCQERGDWPQAVAYLRKLRELQPADRAIYHRLAVNFHAMGMREELIGAFGTFAELSARANDLDAAFGLYLELTGRSPQDPELQALVSQDAMRSYQSYLELISAFMTLLKFHLGEQRSRDLYYLHIKLGLCYTAFGYDEDALAHYHKAVDQCRPKGHSLWTVGVRFLWEGDPNRAMDLFLLALDEPDLTMRDRMHIQFDLAQCCEQKGDLFRAHQLLNDIRHVEEGFLATEIALKRLRTLLGL